MKKSILASLVIFLLFSCEPTTKITGSWKNPKTQNKTYTTIFVAALTGNTVAKSTLENDIADALNKHGIKTVKSMDEFPPDFFKDSVSKDVLLEKVRRKGTEAILTISLIKKTAESRYIGGAYGYAPLGRFGYYGSFGGYYNYWYPYAYNPGYYSEDDIYYLETNLYDSATESLLWSAQSETYSYEGLNPFSKDFAGTIVGRMQKDAVL